MQKLSDKEIIKGIAEQKESVLTHLYSRLFPKIERKIYKHGGNKHDARDIFQDGMVMLCQRAKTSNLKIKYSFENFFTVMCEYMWLTHKKSVRKYCTTTNIEKLVCSDYDPAESDETGFGYKTVSRAGESDLGIIIRRNYMKLPSDCKRVIKMHLNHTTHKQISIEMQYSGEAYARRKKYLSIKKLAEMILNDPDFLKNRPDS